ncbi:MFS family permease [Arthrobacter sp. PvP102]|jgi:MFS family permease|uniref:MFS transporter n=1 Tax=unclassified Arthrobacter TaxID=235627 RepID=UPI001AE44F04|nr:MULTISPECIES: MFS transporter [unclassified Arthrobacter]MBP1234232.1 MFS family permease [Arthrobacter sp. PvP103]MBP1239366.1 MFS family permease [Arthrobacter sp. PvP102]
MVLGFGLVSLAVDAVSDGARPLAGPLLAQLGASALVVGLVTGAAEAAAQGLRLLFGPWADRTGKYWTFTIAGYALTVLCVPLLAVTPVVGAAGLVLASALIIGDRVGKAVRSPAKTVLLASVAGPVGRGRGFAVHKSLDLAGAFAGPLIASAVIAATGSLWPAFAVLAIPGALAMALLFRMRGRVPEPQRTAEQLVTPVLPDAPDTPGGLKPADTPAGRLPGVFLLFALSAFFWSAGLVAFGVIAFHLTAAVDVPVSAVPLVYAAAMAAAALGALASGYGYDRAGGAVLLVLPVLVAVIPVLAFSVSTGPVLAGVLVWGAATGIQDSTVKALVADLVVPARQGTAYGIFAAFEGGGALAGGALYGALYGTRPALIAAVAVLQAVAMVLVVATVVRSRRRPGAETGPGAEPGPEPE